MPLTTQIAAASHSLASGACGLPASIGGSVPPLPKPPALESLLFESPSTPIIALFVIALALFFGLRAQGHASRGLICAGLALLLAGILFLISTLVTTPREHMAQRTRDLVRAATEVDIPTLESLIAPDARLFWPRRAEPFTRTDILERVRRDLGDNYRVESWAVLKMQAVRDGPTVGRTQTQVRINAGGINFSWWKIDWRLGDDDQWRVVGIEPLFISGLSG